MRAKPYEHWLSNGHHTISHLIHLVPPFISTLFTIVASIGVQSNGSQITAGFSNSCAWRNYYDESRRHNFQKSLQTPRHPLRQSIASGTRNRHSSRADSVGSRNIHRSSDTIRETRHRFCRGNTPAEDKHDHFHPNCSARW
jgi:hypothetical protein